MSGSRRWAGLVLALIAVATSACNSRLLRPPVTIFADAGGHQITGTIRALDFRFDSVLLSFFPSNVPLHPSDTLNFEVRDTGEPHTVALGKLVDDALDAITGLGPGTNAKAIEALPQMRRLPRVFPDTPGASPRADGSAIERCFLRAGRPPVSTAGGSSACREQETPEFDGGYSFFSSGYLEEGEPFRIKLSPDIKPGIYGFMCLVHRASMVGSIAVRTPDEERPRVADLRKQADDEEDEVASTLEPAARRAAARRGGAVFAGTGPIGRSRGLVASFMPNETRIGSGESVRWQLYGTHSISFDPSRDAKQGVIVEDDKGRHINLDAWRAVESPAQPPDAVAYPPKAARINVKGGSWDGEGPFSSGILRASQPSVLTYELTFTKAGSYRYLCLVHPRMRGRVVVQGAR